ncbi:hypothetical protein QBC37DRAFT_22453 [Rhypophila decipiens]|uniref:Uncharacterized protein n=1 Tax=Rhypophila decipiens TaxID=261697 RepID=A0AAN6Y1R2_9PEZI|nr:hypothetical protein QBC37DRAFT_22453 [Rhypophila decipiens]
MADQLQEEEQCNPVMGTVVEGQRNLPAMLDASNNDHGDPEDSESPSPPQQNVELSLSRDLDEIVRTFPNSRRLENIIVLWTGRLDLVEVVVVRYTCCLVLENDYQLQKQRSKALDRLCIRTERDLLDALLDDVPALCDPTQKIRYPNTFAATYLQLIATDWFWGNKESMWKHQRNLSRVILSKGGLGESGVDRKLGRMVVS